MVACRSSTGLPAEAAAPALRPPMFQRFGPSEGRALAVDSWQAEQIAKSDGGVAAGAGAAGAAPAGGGAAGGGGWARAAVAPAARAAAQTRAVTARGRPG